MKFQIGANNDLYAIVYCTLPTPPYCASGKTEVHVATAASNYSSFGLQVGTAVDKSSPATFNFVLAPITNDLYAIRVSCLALTCCWLLRSSSSSSNAITL